MSIQLYLEAKNFNVESVSQIHMDFTRFLAWIFRVDFDMDFLKASPLELVLVTNRNNLMQIRCGFGTDFQLSINLNELPTQRGIRVKK